MATRKRTGRKVTTARQKAASRRNLEKARQARSRNKGLKTKTWTDPSSGKKHKMYQNSKGQWKFLATRTTNTKDWVKKAAKQQKSETKAIKALKKEGKWINLKKVPKAKGKYRAKFHNPSRGY